MAKQEEADVTPRCLHVNGPVWHPANISWRVLLDGARHCVTGFEVCASAPRAPPALRTRVVSRVPNEKLHAGYQCSTELVKTRHLLCPRTQLVRVAQRPAPSDRANILPRLHRQGTGDRILAPKFIIPARTHVKNPNPLRHSQTSIHSCGAVAE